AREIPHASVIALIGVPLKPRLRNSSRQASRIAARVRSPRLTSSRSAPSVVVTTCTLHDSSVGIAFMHFTAYESDWQKDALDTCVKLHDARTDHKKRNGGAADDRAQ